MLADKQALSLIVTYLNNQENNSELRAKIEAFRAQSENNNAYFLEVEQLWASFVSAERYIDVDEEAAVKRLEEKMTAKPIKKKLWANWLSAAAMLLISLGGFLYLRQQSTVKYVVKQNLSNKPDSLMLVDGSRLVLAPSAIVKYPDNFKGGREVILAGGDVFFDIAKDKSHPFHIIMPSSKVTVLGTSFNISVQKTRVELSVKTGIVSFERNTKPGNWKVKAGQAIAFDQTTGTIVPITGNNADAWLTKQLVFVDASLNEVCAGLEKYYGQKILPKFGANKYQNKKLNAKFHDETLADVLNILKLTYNLKIEKHQERITIDMN